MAKLIDLTGKKFGKLTVLERDFSKTGGTYWKCKCECGNIVSTRKDTLTREKAPKRSCGCDTAEKNGATHTKDEVGNRYGKLVVLYRSTPLGSGVAKWMCQCDCGKLTEVTGTHLRGGNVQSCGCLKHESKNWIDETGKQYGRLTVLRQDGKINSHYAWLCECACGNLCRIDGTHLRQGVVQSCGCLAKEVSSKVHLVDEVNNKYGNLTVIGRDMSKNTEGAYWICKCECGNLTSVLGTNLRRGNVKSCGCLKSAGEKEIIQLLLQHNILFEQEYQFADLKNENNTHSLRFDFAIFTNDNKLLHLIEYDGIQHFEPVEYFGGEAAFQRQQYNDKKKEEYCLTHNIKLIRIKYNDIITIEKLLDKERS